MSNVFVIQNQSGRFLSRQKEWIEKTEISALYKAPHRDLAVNELFEITSKDTGVRAKVVSAETTSKGLPLVADLPALEFPKFELPEGLEEPKSSSEVAAEKPHQDQPGQPKQELEIAALDTNGEQPDVRAQAQREANAEQI